MVYAHPSVRERLGNGMFLAGLIAVPSKIRV